MSEKLAVKEKVIEPIVVENENGNHALIPTKQLPIASQVSNEEMIAEEKKLLQTETAIEKNYEGFRGYLRLFHVSKVIGMLSLYLYLDQLDVHIKQQNKHAENRLETAYRLTRMAVWGEKLYNVRLWFVHQFLYFLRWWFVGNEVNKDIIWRLFRQRSLATVAPPDVWLDDYSTPPFSI